MNLSLRSKIALIGLGALLFSVLAVMAASGWVFYRDYSDALQSRSTAIAKGLAIQLERVVQLGIRPDELLGFEAQLLEAVNSYEGIAYAFVAKADGTILFHSDDRQNGHSLNDPALRAAIRAGTETVVHTDENGLDSYVALVPLREDENNERTAIGVVISAETLRSDLNTLLLLALGAGLLSLALGITLLLSALSYFVTRPLSAFVTTLDRIRQGGDLSVRADRSSNDELGVMVDGFNTLLDHIARRDHELVRAKKAADAANHAKSQFLATMSHELRTPMHAVLSMTELLLRTELNTKQHRFASTVQNSGRSLLKIINEILDFSKVETGKLDIETIEFDLRAKVEEVVRMLAEHAARKNLDLAWRVAGDVPTRVTGDPMRIAQMLTNLVGNAIKFTEQGGVLIEVSKTSDHFRFAVTDSGIGIDAAQIPQLFEPFQQADNSFSRRFGGTGLGLAIVRQLATAMNGDANAQAMPGGGSCFWFTAQLGTSESDAEPPAKIDLTVLAHVPLPMTAQALRACAQEWQLELDLSATAEELAERLQQSTPAGGGFDVVVLTDLKDNRANLAAVHAIISNLEHPPALIVLGQERHDAVVFGAGADTRLLHVPLNHASLLACLREVHDQRIAQTAVAATPSA